MQHELITEPKKPVVHDGWALPSLPRSIKALWPTSVKGMIGLCLTSGSLDTSSEVFNAAWISATSGQWTDAFRWNTFGFLPFPNNNKTDTYNVMIALDAAPYINLNTAVEIQGLNLRSGFLQGSDSLTVWKDFHWSGGGFTGGAGQLIAHQQVIIDGATKVFRDFMIINESLATWTTGDILGGTGARFLNTSSGTLDIALDGNWLVETNQTRSVIENLGHIYKDTYVGTTLVQADLINKGRIDLGTGRLKWDGLVRNEGSINGLAETTYHFAGEYIDEVKGALSTEGILRFTGEKKFSNIQGSFKGGHATVLEAANIRFNPSASLVAIGKRLIVDNSNVGFYSGEQVKPEVLIITGDAQIEGADDISVGEYFIWESGTKISGPGQLENQTLGEWCEASPNLEPRELVGRPFHNHGIVTWSGGDTMLKHGSTFTNHPTALFLDKNHGTLGMDDSQRPCSLVNLGRWGKDLPGGWTTIQPTFVNSGLFDLQNGYLRWEGSLHNDGTMRTRPDQLIRISGEYYSSKDSSLIAKGTVWFDGSNKTIDFKGTYEATGSTVLAGPTLRFGIDSTVKNLGREVLVQEGALALETGVPLEIQNLNLFKPSLLRGSDILTLSGKSLWNAGARVEGSLSVINAGDLALVQPPNNEEPSGLLKARRLENRGNFTLNEGEWLIDPETQLFNSATGQWTINGRVSSIDPLILHGPPLLNQGVLNVMSGMNPCSLNWRITNSGALGIGTSNVTLTSTFNSIGGEVHLEGGSLNAPRILFEQSVVRGHGTLSGKTEFIGHNRLEVASGGLRFDGGLTLDPAGSTELIVNENRVALTSKGVTKVSGRLVLDWQSNELPSHGTVIPVIETHHLEGTFEKEVLSNRANEILLHAVYHSQGLSVIAFRKETLSKQKLTLVTLADRIVLFCDASGQGRTVQYKDDLNQDHWKDLDPQATGPLEFMIGKTPNRFFRLGN